MKQQWQRASCVLLWAGGVLCPVLSLLVWMRAIPWLAPPPGNRFFAESLDLSLLSGLSVWPVVLCAVAIRWFPEITESRRASLYVVTFIVCSLELQWAVTAILT